MKKKNVVIVIGVLFLLIVGVLIGYRFYIKRYKKTSFKENVIISQVDVAYSYFNLFGEEMRIDTNIFEVGNEVTIEGVRQNNKYSINKVTLDVLPENKKDYIKNVLASSDRFKELGKYVKSEDVSCVEMIPVKVSGQEIKVNIDVLEYIKAAYRYPFMSQQERSVSFVKQMDSVEILDVMVYYDDGRIVDIDFDNDDEITFDVANEIAYYGVTFAIENGNVYKYIFI